jgi:predicted cation transporter
VADHNDPIGEPTLVQAEPVVTAEVVRGVLVAVVAAGWLVIPDATINLIVSGVMLVGSIVTTWWARRKVVPTAKLEA